MATQLNHAVVPSVFAMLLYEHLDTCGYDPVAVLGCPRPTLSSNEIGSIELKQWEDMLQTAAECLQDRHLGLKLGEKVAARHLGAVGHLLLVCKDFGSALQRLEDYQRLVFDVIPMTRRTGPGWIEMVWDISQNRTTVLVGETGFASMVNYCRSIVKGDAHPLRIEFAHPPPDDVRPYEAFFQCPVLFGCAEPLIRLSPDLLSMPLEAPDPTHEQLLERHAQQLLARLPQEEAIVEQVRKLIASSLRSGEPDINKVSATLSQSSRTLQRQLTAAGTSFRKELNLVRSELAQGYLKDPQLRISDIAMFLGYSEHSAFTRAFRKSTGLSPQEARDKANNKTSPI